MKIKRNPIHASIRMAGTTCPPPLEVLARPRRNAVKAGRSPEAAQQRGPASKWRNLIQISLLCGAMLQAVTSGAQPVTKIVVGEFHSLFLKTNGNQEHDPVKIFNLAVSVTSSNATLVIRPILDWSRNAGKLVLKWNGSYVSQSATNVLGPYTDVAIASNSSTNNASALPSSSASSPPNDF